LEYLKLLKYHELTGSVSWLLQFNGLTDSVVRYKGVDQFVELVEKLQKSGLNVSGSTPTAVEPIALSAILMLSRA
jgi:hypothetical protein